ncbi:uncharacterized protein EI90DRAFT_3125180 [Cantharellus anzutake]|uniref:uncharacterized protein n=1 Tax=Cantharellus anzutake TaxID=1750568 RepID=UPI001904AAA8|nr:uncharacterized protein EI90DRAFT_3125180 [Cantharellus anzutake]KAF8329398.1 hypothetical protein EI90DRAFT_3125180 [Cantharellus anzutake]
MTKGGKSSASSGTRKKHARKAAAGSEPVVAQQASTKKAKLKKGEKPPPKVKQFIPPSKPAPVKVDPLDSLGLASTLDQDLVFILRKLAKKDSVTREKAIEDLRTWADNHKGTTLSDMMPVWLSHLPSLFLHPSKRLRVLSSSLHGKFLTLSESRAAILHFFTQTADASESKPILGSWLLSVHDVDISVRRESLRNWTNFTVSRGVSSEVDYAKQHLDLKAQDLLDGLSQFSVDALLNSDALFLNVFPPAPTAPEPPLRGTGQRRSLGKQREPLDSTVPEEPTRKLLVEEEAENDRRARLRIGALGAIEWLLGKPFPDLPILSDSGMIGYFRGSSTKPQSILTMLQNILLEPAIFSSLFHGRSLVHAPGLEFDAFGYSQPLLRQSAWALVHCISQFQAENNIEDLNLLNLSIYAMGSAWDEPDPSVRIKLLVPLVTLLKNVPKVWIMPDGVSDNADSGSGDDAIEAEDDDEDAAGPATVRQESPHPLHARDSSNWPYQKFLEFLQSGCNGSPLEAYPIVVLILSTIPSTVLPLESTEKLKELFDHLWAGLQNRTVARALQRDRVVTAFLDAILDSVWLCARKFGANDARTVGSGVGGSDVAEWLVQTQWDQLWQNALSGSLHVPESLLGSSIGKGLISVASIHSNLFHSAWKPITCLDAAGLMSRLHNVNVLRITRAVDDKFATSDGSNTAYFEALPPLLLDDSILHALQHSDDRILEPSQIWSLYKEYGSLQPERAAVLWSLLVRSASKNKSLLSILLEEPLLEVQAPDAEVFSDFIVHTLSSAFDPEDPQNEESVSLMEKLLRRRNAFLSPPLVDQVKAKIGSATESATRGLLNGVDTIAIISACQRLSLQFLSQMDPEDDFCSHLAANMFVQAELLATDRSSMTEKLNSLVRDWIRRASSNAKRVLASTVQNPLVFLDLALHISRITGFSDINIDDVLPTRQFFNESLAIVLDFSPSPSLAVFDSLVPVQDVSSPAIHIRYDENGYSSYGRVLVALLELVSSHRHVGRVNPWVIEHLAILELMARDFVMSPASPNPLFRSLPSEASLRSVETVLDASKKATTYILSFFSTRLDADWHRKVAASIRPASLSRGAATADGFALFVSELLRNSIKSKDVNGPRVLRTVLHGVLRESGTPEVDIWLSIAREVQEQAIATACAICGCITELNFETPRLDRYRNELASRISGVASAEADTQGLRLLRLLNACAPSDESYAVFLPQQRVVFMLQGLQKWVAEDADLGAQLELELVTALTHIVSLIQSVPGAHWDLISSLIEMNLEACCMLLKTLKLLVKIDDLASSNKALHLDWTDRQRDIYPLVRKLLFEPADIATRSKPREELRSLVVDIASYAGTAILDDSSFEPLCSLLSDSSLKVKMITYELLLASGKARTEKLVIEGEVDVSGDFRASLPVGLMSLLSLDFEVDDDSRQALSFFLGWMVVFGAFSDATPRIKQGYIEQLREAEVVDTGLLPSIFEILNVDKSGKPYLLDPWSLDEFYVSFYDTSFPESIHVLAAHVYYRALIAIPSIIRTWWMNCKDRTLSSSVTHFTSQYFAPIIIKRHLDSVRSPNILKELQDDSFGVKIIPTMREIRAIYNVDDQQMEIGLQLPADYPLHGAEVKDVGKIGVPESKWRAWLFNVQQISQNGLLVDALFWFKKNVASYFEGKTECAICYAIISVMDRSLPTKPCKTCKNRFHASCLYKLVMPPMQVKYLLTRLSNLWLFYTSVV